MSPTWRMKSASSNKRRKDVNESCRNRGRQRLGEPKKKRREERKPLLEAHVAGSAAAVWEEHQVSPTREPIRVQQGPHQQQQEDLLPQLHGDRSAALPEALASRAIEVELKKLCISDNETRSCTLRDLNEVKVCNMIPRGIGRYTTLLLFFSLHI